MMYRLAFIRTEDGCLKITASAKGMPSLRAIHTNPRVMESALRLANVPPDHIVHLKKIAEEAWAEVGLDVCGEAIELDSEQVKHLGFGEAWRRLA